MAARGALVVSSLLSSSSAAAVEGGDEPVAAPTASPPSAAETRFLEQVEGANAAEAAAFPAAGGRTLQELANLAEPGPQVALASSVFTPGPNRFAFGVIGADNALVFAPTAVYVGRGAGAPAAGPFRATLDPLLVDERFQSQASASAADIFSAIYSTELRLPGTGTFEVLVVSRDGGRLIGAPTIIRSTAGTAVPAVGERPSRVSTDTLTSAGGDVASIDTREPTSGMHGVDFASTFDAEGRVAARLEGSFGVGEFREALEAALDPSAA